MVLILIVFWIINEQLSEILDSVKDVSVSWVWARYHKATLFSFRCSDYFIQVLFMSHSTVFYKAKPKAHNTYIAWEAVPSQISQHLKWQETLL